MQQIEFFSLSRPIQERFIEAARAQGAPVPILVARPPAPLAVLAWAGAGAALLLVWIAILGVGYGNLSSSFAIAPVWTIGVYATLILAALLCGLRARSAWNKRRALPFLPTVYMFPIGVIDARTNRFVVHPFNDVTKFEATSRGLKLRFASGFTYEFNVPANRRDEAVALVESHRQKLASLSDDAREKELILLDPLRDNGFRNPFSPIDSMRPTSSKGWYKEPAMAIVIALLLAGSVYRARNVLSEAKLYTDARALDTTAAYRAYLARGGQRPDVADVLLPRAELREAAQEGSVDAIERYMSTHPESKIGPEIQGELKKALLKSLQDAQSAGALSALAKFQARYGKHGLVDQEVSEARKRHLASVLQNFEQKSNGDPELIDFVRRLINWSAKRDPKVVVRFRRRLPSTLEDAQKLILKSTYFAGEATLPSKFFSSEALAERERVYGQEIIARLQQVLPAELARFELEPTVEEASEEVPKVEVPTLLVTYRYELSGAYMSRQPRAVFAGVGIFVKTHFLLPADEKPLNFSYKAWHVPDIRRLEAGELEVVKVYDDVTDKAFRKFLKKYWAEWFKEP